MKKTLPALMAVVVIASVLLAGTVRAQSGDAIGFGRTDGGGPRFSLVQGHVARRDPREINGSVVYMVANSAH